jgi:hypothetical protein
MNFRTLFLALVVIAIAALAALNWTTLATPTLVSLGFTVVNAPLGLVMLGLQAQRELADKAEASRFNELRNFLDAQQTRAIGAETDIRNAVLARLDQLERSLAVRIEQSDNATAAYVGELDDRLKRRAMPMAS